MPSKEPEARRTVTVKIEGLERLKQSSRRVQQNVAKELQIGVFASGKKIGAVSSIFDSGSMKLPRKMMTPIMM